jgi:hypothetical protein
VTRGYPLATGRRNAARVRGCPQGTGQP